MESANLHYQHQLQDQLVGSSSLTPPSGHGVGNAHSWSSNTILNTDNFNSNANGIFIVNARNSRQQNDMVPSLNNSMIQDLGSHWNSYTGSFISQPFYDQHLSRIKAELSDSQHECSDIVNSRSSSIGELRLHPTSFMKNGQHLKDVNEKLLLRTFSSGCQISGLQLPEGQFYSSMQNVVSNPESLAPSEGIFSQIFPTINISNLNQSPSMNSLDMNLQAFDLHTSANLSGSNLIHPSKKYNAALTHGLSYGLNPHQPSHRRLSSPTKVFPFTDGIAEPNKRSSSRVLEPKVSQATPKKSRLESGAACPPLKVRKEKLGDRIAAIQQLVAPFGKTDTASVLMEALGYIKFLQNQVETLSVPYMKSPRNKTNRAKQGGSSEAGHEEPNRDLRSRGLCLVPLSCLSYFTDDSGGVWPHPNFTGGI